MDHFGSSTNLIMLIHLKHTREKDSTVISMPSGRIEKDYYVKMFHEKTYFIDIFLVMHEHPLLFERGLWRRTPENIQYFCGLD